ncbi:unnamed protein product [Rhizophagus irregularis]|nr:unnamed protein product [Rhizophagus irregularis]
MKVNSLAPVTFNSYEVVLLGSSGIELENSIYNAYCHLIRSSEHFIYIENQFFITASEKILIMRSKTGSVSLLLNE